MDKLDKGTELLLYISAGAVSGLLAFMFATQPYSWQTLGNNALALIFSISAFFFIVLTLVKLEKEKKVK